MMKRILFTIILALAVSNIWSLNISHPCMLHTRHDITRVKGLLGTAPWSNAYSHLQSSSYASTSYTEHTSALLDGYLKRMDATNWSATYSDCNNYTAAMRDAAATYQLALMYQLSGESRYADAAIKILNAWATNCKGILRKDGYTNSIPDPNEYLINIQAYQFANAAELLRSYSGWSSTDFSAFQSWMKTTFYSVAEMFLANHNDNAGNMHYWLNWDLANLTAVLSIGILCDDETLINYAINYFKTNTAEVGCITNAVPYLHEDTDNGEILGQCEESGRDQGHATLCASLMGVFCQMAYNIGEDLFAYDDFRALHMAEYVAKYNMLSDDSFTKLDNANTKLSDLSTTDFAYDSSTFPYTSYTNPSYTNSVISTTYRGTKRPCWELFYGYATSHNLQADYCKKWSEQMRTYNSFGCDGGSGDYGPNSGGFDQLGQGTLMFAIPDNSEKDLINLSTSISATTINNSTSFSVSTTTDEEGQKSFSFTPSAAGEFAAELTANDQINRSDAFLVVEASSNLAKTTAKLAEIDIDGNTGYTNTSTNNYPWLTTLSNGHQLEIINPVAASSNLLAKYLSSTKMNITKTKLFLYSTDANAMTIYRVGFYNLGEILSMYPELQYYNFRYVSNDNIRIEADGSKQSTFATKISIKDATKTTTLNIAKLMLETLGTLPSSYTNLDFRNIVFASGESASKEDLLKPFTGSFLMSTSNYQYFPTLRNGAVRIAAGIYNAYKDNIAPSSIIQTSDGAKSTTYYDYTRNLKAGNNSCILPFDVTSDAFSNLGLTAYTFGSYTNGTATFITASGTITAGTPMVINAATAGLYMIPSANMPNVISSPSDYYSISSGNDRYVGSFTYAAPTTYANRYALDSNASEFKLMDDNVYTSYYRAFLSLGSAVSGAKAVSFSLSNATVINEIRPNKSPDEQNIYTIQGIKTNDISQPGLYIVNGKKMVIK